MTGCDTSPPRRWPHPPHKELRACLPDSSLLAWPIAKRTVLAFLRGIREAQGPPNTSLERTPPAPGLGYRSSVDVARE
jgi:hypothetical protein